jgi:hypothetical protein
MDDELGRICNEEVVTYSRYCPATCLDVHESKRNVSHNKRCSRRNSNPSSPECNTFRSTRSASSSVVQCYEDNIFLERI